MTTAGRGIRNAFRSATRTVSIILILGLAIGLAVVMLTAHRSVSDKGILSEPCDSPVCDWPYHCKLGHSAGTYQSYLISKGIFERAINCSNHNLKDSELTTFASVNAASIARLPHFGFLWDSPNANKPVIFATQVSVLDGLNAAMTGSYAIC